MEKRNIFERRRRITWQLTWSVVVLLCLATNALVQTGEGLAACPVAKVTAFQELVFFRLAYLPAGGARPWVFLKLLPKRVPYAAVESWAKVLAVLRKGQGPIRGTLLVGIVRPLGHLGETMLMRARQAVEDWVHPGQFVLVRLDVPPPPINARRVRGRWQRVQLLERAAIEAQMGYRVPAPQFRGCFFPTTVRFVIPQRYSNEIISAWRFYNTHRAMFSSAAAKANQEKLGKFLVGKNIFLAQEAWITLLKAKPSLLSEKFVGQLIPKLGPNRQAYFIYEMFDHRRNGFPAAVARLVVKATTSAQLVPPATACAYASQWQRSSIAGAILQQINKKSVSFGTHTTADKEINKLLRFAGLKPLNQVNP